MTRHVHEGRPTTVGNRIAPPRFLLFLALLPAGFATHRVLLPAGHWADAAAMAFDLAALVFLASLIPLVRDAHAGTMRVHAATNDANRGLVLVLTTLLGFSVMAAITGELGGARDGNHAAMAKLIGTLFLIWAFANSVYALHYAHAWYSRDRHSGKDAGGIAFPGTDTPCYSDFFYFAFTLGMTFQTSDVAITRPAIRRIVLLHSVAAFVFNIGVIAFAINVMGGSPG